VSLPLQSRVKVIIIKKHSLGWLTFITLVCFVGFGLVFFLLAYQLDDLTEFTKQIPGRLFMDVDSGAGSGEDDPGLSSGSSDSSDVDELELLNERLAQEAAEQAHLLEDQSRNNQEEMAHIQAQLEQLGVDDSNPERDEHVRQLEEQVRQLEEQSRQLEEQMAQVQDLINVTARPETVARPASDDD
jgi:hypothetical protein